MQFEHAIGDAGLAPGDERRWQAVATADPRFDGRFVYAVQTTKIFCRPTCPAPRPRRENVRFFASPAGAQAAGYRACKRCRPERRGPERADVREARGAVLFVDLVGSSKRHARLDPSEAFIEAARFFDEIGAMVDAAGGMVAKHMGDGVLAWFGQADGAHNEAAAAVDCALEIRARRPLGLPGAVRQGLHYGRVATGRIKGHSGASELIGHTLNTASRLEGLAKRWHTGLVVSDDCIRASGLSAERLGLALQPGRTQLRGCGSCAVWTPLAAERRPPRTAVTRVVEGYRAAA